MTYNLVKLISALNSNQDLFDQMKESLEPEVSSKIDAIMAVRSHFQAFGE